MNRFLNAFKNIVCALTETQMKALWTFIEEDSFPKEAIEFVKKEYYTGRKSLQIMEYYIFDCCHIATVARHGWTWVDTVAMGGNGWTWMDMSGHCGNGWQ